ncbi:hypothetical protein SDJN03_28229, partial [Cucurbita argyrosperma subsp. sororia]
MKIQFAFLLAILVVLANAHQLQSCRTMKEDRQKWSILLLQQSLKRVPVPPSAQNGGTTIPTQLGQRAFVGKSTPSPAHSYHHQVPVPFGVAMNTN